MIEDILKKIGLNDKEVKIYLTSLQMGAQPASIIASKSNINRSTTYVVLQNLIKKGLVSQFIKAEVKYFSAISPQSLIHYMERLEENLKKQKREVQDLLPQFLSVISSEVSKPKVHFFDGLEGIKAVYEDTLKVGETIYAFDAIETTSPLLNDFIDSYIKKRVEKNIFAHLIISDSKEGKTFKDKDKDSLRETVLIDNKLYHFANEVNIYGDNVAFMSCKDEITGGVGIIIRDFSIAATLREIFKLTWDMLKKGGKKG